MSWYNVKLIFLRELYDQLRDRRTLFMIVVLPILLYPALGMGMVQFTVLFAEQPRQVIVRGGAQLPDDPPLILGEHFNPELFDVPDDAALLEIVPDGADARARLQSGAVQVILVVPGDIRARIAAGELFQWTLEYNSADEKSRIAYLRLKEALDNWKQRIVQARLDDRRLPPDFANPFQVAPHDIASPQQAAGGLIWAKLFPFLLVVMSLTGAFYPAIDLCAGEKERGTMETLLISPAARSEIVLGKYFTVCVFSVGTALLNLLSMACTGWVIARQMAVGIGHAAPLMAPPSLLSAVWMVILLLPLAAFFSALGIALAAFARSTKEGQYYLTPLFLLAMPLVLITLAPGVELNAFYSMVPVSGAALLLKALIQGQYDLALEFAVPVLLPIILYAVLALRWAIDQFSREEVLFREAERLDLWLWARHLLRDRGTFPSAGEAVFCYAVMLLLVWFLGGFVGLGGSGAPDDQQRVLQRSLIVTQLVIVATPPLIMAVMLTSRPFATLLIRRPTRWFTVLIALALALALHPLLVELTHHLERGLPAQPKWVEEHLRQILGDGQSLWWQLFLIALLPAVCEELAFRGFILSGLLRRMSVPTAILVSGFLFGFFHMNPRQLFPATAVGILLGLIATRTGSLLPGICFHFTNNALVLLLARRGPPAGGSSLIERLYDALVRAPDPSGLSPYQLPLLVLSALVSTAILTWLLKQPVTDPAALSACGETNAGGDAAAEQADTFRELHEVGSLSPDRRDARS